MSEFLNMGGYWTYVWPAFGVTIVGLVGASLYIFIAYERARARLEALTGQDET